MPQPLLDLELSSEPSAVQLISKRTILLCAFLTSPLMAGFLYASNLYRTEQKDKIFGSIIFIVISDFFVQIAFCGFEFYSYSFLARHILQICVGLLMIGLLWKTHFSNLKTIEKNEFKWLILTAIIHFGIFAILFILSLEEFSRGYFGLRSGLELVNSNLMGEFILVSFAVVIALFVRIIVKLKSAIFKS